MQATTSEPTRLHLIVNAAWRARCGLRLVIRPETLPSAALCDRVRRAHFRKARKSLLMAIGAMEPSAAEIWPLLPMNDLVKMLVPKWARR